MSASLSSPRRDRQALEPGRTKERDSASPLAVSPQDNAARAALSCAFARFQMCPAAVVVRALAFGRGCVSAARALLATWASRAAAAARDAFAARAMALFRSHPTIASATEDWPALPASMSLFRPRIDAP